MQTLQTSLTRQQLSSYHFCDKMFWHNGCDSKPSRSCTTMVCKKRHFSTAAT